VLNETLIPIANQVDIFLNTFKVLVGGVFGLYLIILYIRWREFKMFKHKLKELDSNIRLIAAKQKVELPPPRRTHLENFWEQLKCQVRK
jgi:hypothetical protein